jgi:hypothetical protein
MGMVLAKTIDSVTNHIRSLHRFQALPPFPNYDNTQHPQTRHPRPGNRPSFRPTMLNRTPYEMSFSTGGLFLTESLKLALSYKALKAWDQVRNQALSDNLLQTRTRSTAQRVIREIISRLKYLSPEELTLLMEGAPQEQSALIWIAVCRRYPFIGEFAVEVLRERYLSLQTHLHHEDFDAFYNRKSDWHPELEAISDSTRKKLRQILFKILKDANLLVGDHLINPPLLSERLMATLSPHTRQQDLHYFPLFDADLRKFA